MQTMKQKVYELIGTIAAHEAKNKNELIIAAMIFYRTSTKEVNIASFRTDISLATKDSLK